MDQVLVLENFYGNLRMQFSTKDIQNLKSFANTNKKVTALKSQQTFLIKCRNKGIYPKNVLNGTPIFNRLVENSHCLYSGIMKLKLLTHSKILNLEIKICIENIKILSSKLASLRSNIIKIFPNNITQSFFNKQMNNSIEDKRLNDLRLSKKFASLQKLQQQISIIDNIEGQNNFVNLSDKNIPNDISAFLGLGPKCSVPYDEHEIPMINIIADTEQIIKVNAKTDAQHTAMRSKVINIITNYIHNGRIHGNRSQYQAKKYFIDLYDKSKHFLKINKDIIITSADKGKKTVAINKKDYLEKNV